MPNWCNNTFRITGPTAKIQALWDQAQKDEREGGGLLQALHPMPNLPAESADHMPNWWNWRVSNWGTKWEVSSEGMEFTVQGDTATLSGWFDSAWAPPVNAFAVYCDEHDDVAARLSYFEPGMCFVGVWDNEVGDECHEYGNYDSKTVRDGIGAVLDDEWNVSQQMSEWEEENSEE